MTLAAGHLDLHQHFGSLIGVPTAGMKSTLSPEEDCASRLAFMDHFGIGLAALMPVHSYSAPNGVRDVCAINDALYAYGRLAPSRFVALFGTVDPRHGRASMNEVERLTGLGFRGISWHHRFQGLPMDHPVMFDIVERMNASAMMAMVHCYANGDFEAVWRLRRLAERFPDMTFVALDAMTSPENVEQLFAVAETCSNVVIDLTSTLLGAQGVLWAIERVGSRRLVFGSNCYSMTSVAQVAALDAIHDAQLSPQDRQAILRDNAIALLGLPRLPERSA
jgi:predicted TIM-barrel fold metal-dependent hydrolase